MKIIALMENTTADPTLQCEHGLSLYIETGEHRILFDMGQTAAFADNAQKLGVDLAAVDLAVLSHGHYDHGGGIARFLEINKTAPLYVSGYAFEPHYNGSAKYIGLDPALLEDSTVRRRFRFVGAEEKTLEKGIISCDGSAAAQERPWVLAPGVELYSCQDQTVYHAIDSAGLSVRQDGQLIPEDFRHEQYLLIHEGGKRVLLSGCSHRGILNILRWFQPDILVGGFHFSKWDLNGEGRVRLDQAAALLSRQNGIYYTCHCTGLEQYVYLKKQMGDRLRYLSTGQVLEIG